MPVIDADAHVVEAEATWEYMDPSEEKYRPQILTDNDGVRYWVIDGKLRGRVRGEFTARGISEQAERRMVTDEAKRLMQDIPGRIAHMDELGIDVQILYPTIITRRFCDTPESEVALSRSYNRWLADIWEQGKGRLRWTCMLPLWTMDEALKQLHWSVEHGACGVTMRAVEDERLIVDPYFDPLYAEAECLNVPIAVHIADSNVYLPDYYARDGVGGTFGAFRLPAAADCHMLITNEMVKRFPNLRWGIIEASSQWVPYVIHDLRRRLETRGRKLDDEPLKANNIWVTCQNDDDLPYVLSYAGDSQLVIGTDYGHQDQSSEIEAMRILRDEGEVDPVVIDKIMGENAVNLYGLEV